MIDTNSPLLSLVSIPPPDQNTPPLRKRGRSQSVGQISIEQRVFAITCPNDRVQIDTPFIYTESTSSDVRRHGEIFSQEIEGAFQSNLTRVEEKINKMVLDKMREDFDRKTQEHLRNHIHNLTRTGRVSESVRIHTNKILQQTKERFQKIEDTFNFEIGRFIQILNTFTTQTIQKIKDLWDQIKGPLKEGLIFAMSIIQNIKFGKLGSLGFIKIGALFSIKYQTQAPNQSAPAATPQQLHIQGNYVANQTIIFNGLPPEGTVSEIVLHCSGCGLHTTHSLTSSPSLPQIAVASN